MKAPLKDVRKLAQLYLRTRGHYSGAIDGLWEEGSDEAYTRYMAFLKAHGLEIGEEDFVAEDGTVRALRGVVVLDPGHGGEEKIGGSSANNATSASGVLEKELTLDLAKRIRKELKALADASAGADLDVHLTRSGDRNLGLAERAAVAASKRADVFVSLHFNAFDGGTRGTETWIFPAGDANVNYAEDRALADRVQRGMVAALRPHDPGTRDRGIKDTQKLGVLRDVHLGNRREDHPTRACLVEVEFIDVPAVDELYVSGPNAKTVQADVARAIAEAIAEDLQANA